MRRNEKKKKTQKSAHKLCKCKLFLGAAIKYEKNYTSSGAVVFGKLYFSSERPNDYNITP